MREPHERALWYLCARRSSAGGCSHSGTDISSLNLPGFCSPCTHPTHTTVLHSTPHPSHTPAGTRQNVSTHHLENTMRSVREAETLTMFVDLHKTHLELLMLYRQKLSSSQSSSIRHSCTHTHSKNITSYRIISSLFVQRCSSCVSLHRRTP